MDRDDGKVEVRESGDSADKVCVVYAFAVIALGLAERVPKSVDGVALEPDEQDLGDIEDDVGDSNGDETAADLWVYHRQY